MMYYLPVLFCLCIRLLHPAPAHAQDSLPGIASAIYATTHVVAHRGAWKNTGAPQNSLASLKAAIAMGCAASEFDIHMTADSLLVINHDADYGGIKVQENTYQKLASHRLTNGEVLPLLKDFIATGMLQNTTKLVLEIKPSTRGEQWAMATTEKVVQMVHTMQAQQWCMYISFDYEICRKIKALDPDAHVQYLGGNKELPTLLTDGISGFDYHYSVLEKQPDLVQNAKAMGLSTNAWTVNNEKTMEWLIKKGIEYITTDEPERLMELIKKREQP